MSIHSATVDGLQAELAHKLRLAEASADTDLPDTGTVERGVRFLHDLGERFPSLLDRISVGVGRDGSIEIVVTLPQWSYTVFADPDEHDLELVIVNRQTDETVDEGFVTAEQVFSNLAARAA